MERASIVEFISLFFMLALNMILPPDIKAVQSIREEIASGLWGLVSVERLERSIK